jgi:hypothetical protein
MQEEGEEGQSSRVPKTTPELLLQSQMGIFTSNSPPLFDLELEFWLEGNMNSYSSSKLDPSLNSSFF